MNEADKYAFEQIKQQYSIHFHPTWETAYYNEKWEFIKDYRTK